VDAFDRALGLVGRSAYPGAGAVVLLRRSVGTVSLGLPCIASAAVTRQYNCGRAACDQKTCTPSSLRTGVHVQAGSVRCAPPES
jgi:hypothetical protein